MTKIVNSWTEFQPLKRVVLGRPEGTQVFGPEPGTILHMPVGGFPVGTIGKFPQDTVDEANEQMDYFEQALKSRGVIVDRVTVHPYLAEVNSFGTPDWTATNFRGTNCPRDLFMPVGNEIMEAPGVLVRAGLSICACVHFLNSILEMIQSSCGLLLQNRA